MMRVNILFSENSIVCMDDVKSWFKENYSSVIREDIYRNMLLCYELNDYIQIRDADALINNLPEEILALLCLHFSGNGVFSGEFLNSESTFWVALFSVGMKEITVVCKNTNNLGLLLEVCNEVHSVVVLNTGVVVKTMEELKREYSKSCLFNGERWS